MTPADVCPWCDAAVPLQGQQFYHHVRVIKQLVLWDDENVNPVGPSSIERCPGSGRYRNDR